jgi:uncharacterized protein with PIN domain
MNEMKQHFIGETTRVTESRCTNCKKSVNSASPVDAVAGTPDPGDFTICIHCGHLMTFADDLALRDLTDDEMLEIAGDERILLVQKARGMMKDSRKD